MKHKIIHTEFEEHLYEVAINRLDKYAESLKNYSEKLLWWNKKINLVSRDVSHETIKEHINHSLLLGLFIGGSDSERIIDAGSGGGLPGIPLAICYPEKKFLLNDVVSKKMLAVKQMINSLHLDNTEVQTGSISEIHINKGELIVTKHAFKLNQLITFLGDKNWGEVLFLKGRNEASQELEGLEEELRIEIFNLDNFFKKEFYSGKAIVRVKRKSNE